MIDKMVGGYNALRIQLLNGRLFQRLLSKEPGVLYRSEQGKILTSLWRNQGEQTVTDIALVTGLANNTLTSMLQRMVKQGLILFAPHPDDKRKKIVRLTEVGWSQQTIGDKVSQELADIFYAGFTEEEIWASQQFQMRILNNLQEALDKKKIMNEQETLEEL